MYENRNDSGTLGISDSGCAPDHVIASKDIHTLADVEEDTSKTDELMTSTHRGTLKLETIPLEARKAYVFKDMASHSLLSTGVLCDSGCKAIYEANKLTVLLKNSVVLTGFRNQSTHGLWLVDLDPSVGHAMNVYPTGTKAKLTAFYKACLCSAPTTSILRAMDMGLKFPGIKRGDFTKYQPSSAAEAKGHLRGTRYHKLRPFLKFLPPDPEGSEGESQAPVEGKDEILTFKFDLNQEAMKPDLSADENHSSRFFHQGLTC